MTERCVAVLGWRDEPTDAVEEYCNHLGEALAGQGIELKKVRVRWPEIGWAKALKELESQLSEMSAKWFLVQYTALGWSRRGFPLRMTQLLRVLNRKGRHCGIVFHDASPYPGDRLADRFRRLVQGHVMRRMVRMADFGVLTISLSTVSWLPKDTRNMRFITVGANLRRPEIAWQTKKEDTNSPPTVVVYSFSNGTLGRIEAGRVAAAVRFASEQIGHVRLIVLGRNSEANGQQLRESLADRDVDLKVHGLVEEEDVARMLGGCDVLLFVRGPISTRRGSALAGIACGLPVIACEGWETAPPITEAGVVLVPDDSESSCGPALVQVLKDGELQASLRERSRTAQAKYFSWERIAASYMTILREFEDSPNLHGVK